MWFSADGENDSDDPEDYDFVVNGGGQVYAHDFILPGHTSIKH